MRLVGLAGLAGCWVLGWLASGCWVGWVGGLAGWLVGLAGGLVGGWAGWLGSGCWVGWVLGAGLAGFWVLVGWMVDAGGRNLFRLYFNL